MYRKQKQQDRGPEEFVLPFGGKLAADNRWVILAEIIPWTEFEAEYAAIFAEVLGAPAKTFRMALGALIIKEKLGTSDRETVEQIRENPYLQYFIGKLAYSNQAPFDPSMLVHFRERIDMNLVNRLNQKIVKNVLENQEGEEVKAKKSESGGSKSEVKNRGKLILDASCAPADISYPTDLELLNQARKEYLAVARKKKVKSAERRKAIKKQLQYIKRNLAHIQQLMNAGASLLELSKRQYKMLLVVAEAYRQQQWLYEHEERSIEDRIVSLSQPHIRPIVRGKAAKNTEFGA